MKKDKKNPTNQQERERHQDLNLFLMLFTTTKTIRMCFTWTWNNIWLWWEVTVRDTGTQDSPAWKAPQEDTRVPPAAQGRANPKVPSGDHALSSSLTDTPPSHRLYRCLSTVTRKRDLLVSLQLRPNCHFWIHLQIQKLRFSKSIIINN